jgi:hypothetical protein
MNMEQTECSETLAFELQTPGNYPKESIQHIEHGESLKSRLKLSVHSSGPGLNAEAVATAIFFDNFHLYWAILCYVQQ